MIEQLRLEALRLAHAEGKGAADIVQDAEIYFSFLSGFGPRSYRESPENPLLHEGTRHTGPGIPLCPQAPLPDR